MKPTFTKEGKEVIKDFIANLKALQKEVVDAEKGTVGDVDIPTEEDILQDILFFEDDFENGIWYPAADNSDYGEWLFLRLYEDYIWE